jgi:hypothetical protein
MGTDDIATTLFCAVSWDGVLRRAFMDRLPVMTGHDEQTPCQPRIDSASRSLPSRTIAMALFGE